MTVAFIIFKIFVKSFPYFHKITSIKLCVLSSSTKFTPTKSYLISKFNKINLAIRSLIVSNIKMIKKSAIFSLYNT